MWRYRHSSALAQSRGCAKALFPLFPAAGSRGTRKLMRGSTKGTPMNLLTVSMVVAVATLVVVPTEVSWFRDVEGLWAAAT